MTQILHKTEFVLLETNHTKKEVLHVLKLICYIVFRQQILKTQIKKKHFVLSRYGRVGKMFQAKNAWVGFAPLIGHKACFSEPFSIYSGTYTISKSKTMTDRNETITLARLGPKLLRC